MYDVCETFIIAKVYEMIYNSLKVSDISKSIKDPDYIEWFITYFNYLNEKK